MKTREELDAEEALAATQLEEEKRSDSDEEIDIDKVPKQYTVDMITSDMNKQMKISKKKKGGEPVVPAPKKKVDLKQKHKNKRSRSQLMF